SLARLPALEEQEFALALGYALQRADFDATFLGELERRRRGCAVLAEGGCDGRSLESHGLRGLRRRKVTHPHGDAPRGGEGAQSAVRERGIGEARAQSVGERALEFRQGQRRQF